MYYSMCIEIAFYTKYGIIPMSSTANVEIKKSVKELIDEAFIEHPGKISVANLKKDFKDCISVNDKVVIKLGYDDYLNTEFTGYIDLIENTFPLKIHLKSELYQLAKLIKLTPKTFVNPSLMELLKYILPNYEVECMEVNIKDSYPVIGTAWKALTELKDNLGFYTKIKDNKIKCTWPYDKEGLGEVKKYYFYKNVKTSNLQIDYDKDEKIRIEASSRLRNGKHLKISVGASSSEATRIIKRTYGWTSGLNESELIEIAERDLKMVDTKNMTGSITGFGVPYVEEGDTLEIYDSKRPERQGAFIVESVFIKYKPTGGFERQCNIGAKLYDVSI